MALDLITLFPEMFTALTQQGVVSRAFKQGLVNVQFWNPREFALNANKTVDDRPYGGGPGMVMMAAPLAAAIRAACERQRALGKKPHVIYLSPQGRVLTQTWIADCLQHVQQQSNIETQRGLVLLCGRYEAIDERLFDLGLIDEELSIGDVVVSGGELPAMLMLDALLRCVEGVLNDDMSAQQDSFSRAVDGLLDCSHYTRPEKFEEFTVPSVLLSGDHAKIAVFRRQQSLLNTMRKRFDLIEQARAQGQLSVADEKFLASQMDSEG
ncbi:tRNA (guanosine(37)-N1)-methyltransferase TrmD [Hydromonas duriensis]|uniref:tRNA (guanosine(37)-N1)-methyltransferase TrmD n=1 Tax=Hydromonas duriensis TaxID=1527608 RepID=UPI0010616F16|nr:tRNA (guanosine(37)-N1)-methyltransferase TrmD [Hydromonas duriensis]